MALVDIEERIIKEAEKEAKEILSGAQAEQKAKLKAIAEELSKAKEMAEAKILKNIKQAVEQKKMLGKLEATQSILKVKRVHMLAVRNEVGQEILSNTKELEAFFKKILKEIIPMLAEEKKASLEISSAQEKVLKKVCQELNIAADTRPEKSWAAGRFEVVLGNSRVDCSLDQFLVEEMKLQEKEIADQLFS